MNAQEAFRDINVADLRTLPKRLRAEIGVSNGKGMRLYTTKGNWLDLADAIYALSDERERMVSHVAELHASMERQLDVICDVKIDAIAKAASGAAALMMQSMATRAFMSGALGGAALLFMVLIAWSG